MSTMGKWIQNDMSGGENQSLQPNRINESQVYEMVNILPRPTDLGFELRHGFKNYSTYGNTFAPFVKRNITGVDTVLAVANPNASTSSIKSFGSLGSGATSKVIYNATTVGKVWWSNWDGNRFFFSNDTIGLHTMLTDDIDGTKRAVKVENFSTGTVKVSDAPKGKYLTQHNGRLFMVNRSDNGSMCSVSCCGSDDAISPRWNSWSGLSASAGGSFDAVPYGTDVTGLASTFGGLVIFKEDRILLLTYSDDSAPWNPTTGANVSTLNTGVGCISHDSIDVSNDIVYFVGREVGNTLGVYALDNTSVSPISTNIPNKMKSILNSGYAQVDGVVVDGYYMLFAKYGSGNTKKAVAVVNLLSGSWVTFDTPEFSGVSRNSNRGIIVSSPNGFYTYPDDGYSDGGGRIPWSITTQRVTSDSQDSDAYWRLAGGRGGSQNIETFTLGLIDDNDKVNNLKSVQFGYVADVWGDNSYWGDGTLWLDVYDPSVDVYEFDAWDDGSLWGDGSVWESQPKHFEFFSEAGIRSNGVQLRVGGNAKSKVYIDYLMLGYRDRRQRNWRYE